MDNKEILEDLKFGIGDGNLHYYIYNWKCPSLKEDKVTIRVFFSFKIVITIIIFIFFLFLIKGRISFAIKWKKNFKIQIK
jgi:hypothetical protein